MADSHRQAFLAEASVDSAWDAAEQQIAAVLNLELEPGEHIGEEWVIDTTTPGMLEKCQALVASRERPKVYQVLIEGLRGSYHLKDVHSLIRQISQLTVTTWRREDPRSFDMRDLMRDCAHAFRYGVRAEDVDLVIELCDDPELAPAYDREDFRLYWFGSLKKLKDPKVTQFCRDVLAKDIQRWDDTGRWGDYRLIEAMDVLGKRWDPADSPLFHRVAEEHRVSEMRDKARRILKRHEPASP